jgi:DNA-binding beta-propeller fold protein YncE
VADVAIDSPAPQLLTRIQGQVRLRRLVVDVARQRLYSLDSVGGRVFSMDLGKSSPQPTLAADGLGKASDIDINRRTGTVYVVNAETRQVWQLACEGGRCTKQVFAHSDAFKRPFRLEITRDGTVWVADAKASRIFGLDPDGSIHHTIASLD